MLFADRIQQRLYDLAIGVIRFCRTLPHTDEAREIARQLRRASAGASANYRSSRRGRSRAEWLSKLNIAVEELDETQHWLTMLQDASIANPPQNLLSECAELMAILSKSIETARRNQRT